MDAIGPYIDSGCAVIDIPDPNGRGFSVYCYGKSTSHTVVTIVTPSGKAQGHHSAGSGGETGDYKVILLSLTGDAQVRVES